MLTARTLLPFDPEVVKAWELGDSNRGALLLHGFAGTPPELLILGRHLAANGWRCVAPALAGHASTPEDLAKTSWEDWLGSAEAALDALRGRCADVVVAGQSMGGTLALQLAARNPDIAAVATLAAPLWIRSRARRFIRLLKPFHRWHIASSEPDLYWLPSLEDLHSYGRRSTAAIAEFFDLLDDTAERLALVRPPVLILQGGRDTVVDPENARDIQRRLVSSRDVEKVLLPRSGHAMSVDVDRDAINAMVLAWFDRFVPAPASPDPPAPAQS